jgi:hypothetical protein
MKKVLLLALAIVMSASFAFAQPGGHIGLYSDSPGYSDCNLNEAVYVTNNVYVVHTLAATGNTAQFMIQNNWPGPLAGAINWGSNLTLGNPYTGIAVTYVGCKVLPYLLGTMGFIPLAISPPCTATMQVVADPAVSSGSVEVVDCSSVVQLASGGLLTINGNSLDCPCIVGTEETNWSKIKALYQ